MVGTTSDDYLTITSTAEFVSGLSGNDTFVVLGGKVNISDLETGDIIIVSSGGEITTNPIASFTASDKSSNAGVVNITAATSGGVFDLSLSSVGGYNLISGEAVDNFKGSSGNDTFTIIKSGEGDSDIYDGLAGSDKLMLSVGSHVFSSDANLKNIETVLANTAGSSVNLSAQTEGFTITGVLDLTPSLVVMVLTLLLVELVMIS